MWEKRIIRREFDTRKEAVIKFKYHICPESETGDFLVNS